MGFLGAETCYLLKFKLELSHHATSPFMELLNEICSLLLEGLRFRPEPRALLWRCFAPVGRQDVGKQSDTTIGPHHFRRRISTWHILKPIIAALVSVLNSRIAVRFGLSEQIIGFSTQSEKEYTK
jgi:hypothetical protein